MPGLFITGTDTGVGKSVLAACLIAAMRSRGREVLAHKPVISGVAEAAVTWPADHVLLGRAAQMDPQEVCKRSYELPLPPVLAAKLAGEQLSSRAITDDALAALEAAGSSGRILVVEGAGGLLSPLADDLSVLDLAGALQLPLLIAARPGLGTINHSLLSLQAARAAGLSVAAIVLCAWPDQPTELELYNQSVLEADGAVTVQRLPVLAGSDAGSLTGAGERLPWESWLGD